MTLIVMQFAGLEEHRGPQNLEVKGSIPSWAAGTLFRTGPGQSQIDNTSRGTHYVSHWFDGFAHTHKFDISPGETDESGCSVTYSSCRQSEQAIEAIKKRGWCADVSFGQRNDPCVGIFAKFMSVFSPRQINNNVSVMPNMPGLGGRSGSSGHRKGVDNLYLCTDHSTLQKLDPKTLEPLGQAAQDKLHPELKGALSSAHAQRDPETGDVFNFNLDFGRSATYRIFRVNADTGTTDILATISDQDLQPAYIHSFFLTHNYVILCVPSSHFGWKGFKVLWERNLIEAIKPFSQDAKCKWLVVDRRHGRGVVARFSTPAAFFFHSVNAFEEKGKDEHGREVTNLFLDYVKYDDTGIMHKMYYDVLLNRSGAASSALTERRQYESVFPSLVRHKFTLHAMHQGGTAYSDTAEEVFSIPGPHAGELPVINPMRIGKAHRFVFGVSSLGRSILLDSLVKTDVHTRDALIWTGPPGHSPGEPIFVPRPGGTDEDDGVILSLVLDGSAQRSYLLCLDARTLQELGRAATDFPIPLGLHGTHVAS